jgi:hypothetical protein
MARFLRPIRLDDALAALAVGPHTLLAGGIGGYTARATYEPDEDIAGLPEFRHIERKGSPGRMPALATCPIGAGAAMRHRGEAIPIPGEPLPSVTFGTAATAPDPHRHGPGNVLPL